MSKITIDRSVVEQALEALDEADLLMEHRQNIELRRSALVALREALKLPQVEQGPVAWIERWYGSGPERGWWIVCGRDHIAHLGPAEMSGEAASKIVSAHNTSPPAQRQPLTDEQIHDCFQHRHRDKATERRMITRSIERAHGIGGEA